MTCQDVRERLSVWRDGEAAGSAALPSEERLAVRAHLDECAACRETLDALDRTASDVRRLPPLEPPSSVTQRALALGRKHADDMASAHERVLTARLSAAPEPVARRAATAAPAPAAPAPAELRAAKRSPLLVSALVAGLLVLLLLLAYALGFGF